MTFWTLRNSFHSKRYGRGTMTKSVAELCQEQEVALEGLIAKSGLDKSRVQAIVEGRWTPSPNERQRIADALGVQPDDITWGHKTPIQHLWGHGPT